MPDHSAVTGDRRDRGFTLIEVMLVVVIIGVLVAIAVPLYLNHRQDAADKTAQADLRSAIGVLEQCRGTMTVYPSGLHQSGGSPDGCTQIVTLSAGTRLRYSTATPFATYQLVTSNNRGTKIYCYNSATGGAVQHVDGANSLLTTTC